MVTMQKYEYTEEEFKKICTYQPITNEYGADLMEIFFKEVKPLIYLVGARKQGKTALMARIAENYHAKKREPIYCIGFPNIEDYPPYFIPIRSGWEISKPGLLLVDEAGLNKPQMLNELLAISGHKDFGMIYAGQTLKQIKPSTIEMIDANMFKKPTHSQISYKMYRKEYKETMKYLTENLSQFNDKAYFYFDGGEVKGWFKSILPTFWEDGKTSKGYRSTNIINNNKSYL